MGEISKGLTVHNSQRPFSRSHFEPLFIRRLYEVTLTASDLKALARKPQRLVLVLRARTRSRRFVFVLVCLEY